ncbi:MAG: septum formation initiator family protein [Alloprevotella sp.]|nr:septum formation initiator family protein [Alloprevotella sp.]
MGKKLSYIGQSILRHKYLWTIILFVIIVGFIDSNSMLQRYKLSQNNAAIRAEIKQYDERYKADSRTFRDLQMSEEAVENVARVELFMKTDNEDVYVIEEN